MPHRWLRRIDYQTMYIADAPAKASNIRTDTKLEDKPKPSLMDKLKGMKNMVAGKKEEKPEPDKVKNKQTELG